ncbi:hypothetical protein scyTo_0021975, partial [Scyliorhinus torazame]|nr:hypothetical protein [Scyliorhinus torazame]
SGYDDYSYGQGSGSNYGYGGKSWELQKGNQTSESLVAKINQRLDLLSRNEGDDQERFSIISRSQQRMCQALTAFRTIEQFFHFSKQERERESSFHFQCLNTSAKSVRKHRTGTNH